MESTKPAIRRMKTYTGGQGYVYQYYFVGKRAAKANSSATATEYIFDVTSDRKTTFAVSVFIPEESIRQWTANHGRTLTDAEQYGAVKMHLFRAFDEIENMMTDGRQLFASPESVEQVLATLGVE